MITRTIAGLDWRPHGSPSLLECLSLPGVWLGFDGGAWRIWAGEAQGWSTRWFSTRLEAAQLVASTLRNAERDMGA